MQIDCPKCGRPVTESTELQSSAQYLRCPWCSFHFSPQDDRQDVSFTPSQELATETWEFSIDEDEEQAIADKLIDGFGLEASSEFYDIGEETHNDISESPSIEIPDLPEIPKPVAHIVQMSNAGWSPILNEVEEGIPALPEMDLDLQEAPIIKENPISPESKQNISAKPYPKAVQKIVAPQKPKSSKNRKM